MYCRLLLTLAALLACAGTPALAAPPARPPAGFPSLPQEVTSAHFVVHYATTGGNATSAQAAATLSGNAETAYSWIVGTWSYPPPRDDGDGRTDVYVVNLPGLGTSTGPDDGVPDQTTAYLIVPPSSIASVYPVAHEFFHAIQMGIYQHEQSWLDESTAEWAGQNVISALGMEAKPNWFPHPWVSLDCMGSSCKDGDVGGYRGSIFMEYLDERYGMDLVHDVYTRAAALGVGNHQQHSIQALSDAIAARGGSLSDAFVSYALAASSGAINRPGVTDSRPGVFSSFVTGTLSGGFEPIRLSTDHLGFTNLLLLGNQPGLKETGCTAKTLGLEVALPTGIPTGPALVQGTTVTPLAVAGTLARATVPWTDCSTSAATLVLPNGNTTAEAQPFDVTIRLSATPAAPPATGGSPVAKATRLSVKAKAGRRGRVTLLVTTAAAGRLDARATSRRGRVTRTYATATRTLRRAAAVTLTLKPRATAARLLRAAGKLKLAIAVTFRPATGAARTVHVICTVKR